METYFETYVIAGGPLMVVLILCSLILGGAFLQALIRLRKKRLLPKGYEQRAGNAKSADDRVEFARSASRDTTPLGRALYYLLYELDLKSGERPHTRQLDPLIQEGAEEATEELYERLGVFATLYTIAPLLGLLGTIMGMIGAFREFAVIEQKDLSALSEGIQQALVTTLWGLGIAILAYLASQYFQGRIRRFEKIDLPDRIHKIVEHLYGLPKQEKVIYVDRESEKRESTTTVGSKPVPAGGDAKTPGGGRA